jgi:hypothetical protein
MSQWVAGLRFGKVEESRERPAASTGGGANLGNLELSVDD